jgi:hypothetical protein
MSNTRTIAAALWFLTMTVAVAQNYPAASIADSLKQNAHSVVRLYEESFTVVSPSEGLHKIH